jgi:hypothetical protein
MSIPIDTQKPRFMTADVPFAAVDYETKAPKLDRSGIPVWIVPITLMCPGQKAKILNVRVPGEPKGLQAFQYVKLHNFFLTEWKNDKGNGLVYDASAVEPETVGKS